MKRFEGKKVLVTGTASGIGKGIAERFAAEGASLVMVDRTAEAGEAGAAALRAAGHAARFIAADVTDDAAITAAAEAAGPVDVLVNNAGGTQTDTYDATTPELFRQDVELNLTSVYVLTRAVLPGMVARGKGAIVNIATVNALMALGNPAYSAAKAGLVNLTLSLATEYAPKGIRVNAVLPGTVRTPVWDYRVKERPDVFEKVTSWYPIGRVGRPEDIAAAVAFLAADEAAFITGASLLVDGGLAAGLSKMIRDITGA